MAVRIGESQVGAANRTGDRFGVISAVGRISVFATTLGTEQKAGHRGAFPVIGRRMDQGISRSAVGAGDKGVTEAAVMGIEQFGAAGRTEGSVGRQDRTHIFSGHAGENAKGRVGTLGQGYFGLEREGIQTSLRRETRG
jgi:hypothetical protein